MKAVVVALMLAVSSAKADSPADAYRQDAADLAKQDDGFGMLDASAGASASLRGYEKAFQAWAADWFGDHSTTDFAAFAMAANALGKDVEADAIRLDAHSVLVRVRHGQLGSVFVLSDRTGRYVTAWDIADAGAAPTITDGRELEAWAPARSTGDCRNTAPNPAKAVCGPLSGHVAVLPAGDKGHARFYVDGSYGREAGATGGQQFSVWTWDGKTARPVLVHSFAMMADQDGPKVSGNVIRIPAKGRFRTMYACGACVGREMQIVIRLDAPKGAKLAGERSLTPELDLIDELYDRVLRRKSVSDIASPLAAKRVADEVRTAKPDDFPLGMIDSWTVSRTKGRHVVCLNSDNKAGAHLFTFEGPPGRRKIADVQPTSSACTGPGARS